MANRELVFVVVVRPAARENAVPFTPDDLPGSHPLCINPVDILALIEGSVSAWISASAVRQLSKEDASSLKLLAREQTAELF
jgi:hypothetical protein